MWSSFCTCPVLFSWHAASFGRCLGWCCWCKLPLDILSKCLCMWSWSTSAVKRDYIRKYIKRARQTVGCTKLLSSKPSLFICHHVCLAQLTPVRPYGSIPHVELVKAVSERAFWPAPDNTIAMATVIYQRCPSFVLQAYLCISRLCQMY